MQRFQQSFQSDFGREVTVILIRLLQPGKRLVPVAKLRVQQGHIVRPAHLVGGRAQLSRKLFPPEALTSRLSHRGPERRRPCRDLGGIVTGPEPASLVFFHRVGVSSDVGIDASQIVVGAAECRIGRDRLLQFGDGIGTSVPSIRLVTRSASDLRSTAATNCPPTIRP